MYSMNARTKRLGEMLVRTLGEKAIQGYNNTEPLEVYTESEPNAIIMVKDCDGVRMFNDSYELTVYLESLA